MATGWLSEELLANPDAPPVIKYDPAKVHGAGDRKGKVAFLEPAPEQPCELSSKRQRCAHLARARIIGHDQDKQIPRSAVEAFEREAMSLRSEG